MGVAVGGCTSCNNHDPPPQPSPTRGREQTDYAAPANVRFNKMSSREVQCASRDGEAPLGCQQKLNRAQRYSAAARVGCACAEMR